MADCCSPYCRRYNECEGKGILRYMKVINKHPSQLNKKWCESFEEAESEIREE